MVDEKESKTCKDCVWLNKFSFKDGWCDCLLPNKENRKYKTRSITHRDNESCNYFKYLK